MKKIFNKNVVIFNLLLIVFVFIYNEYLVYYQVLYKCNWNITKNNDLLNIILISDTHLLGSRNGHWFDKLRREWQQYRSFQTARYYLEPDYIVILGDLTDEGKWCSDAEWNYYENRAKEIFYTDKSKLLVIVGNHDVGFHYDINEKKLNRFNKSFNIQYINLHVSEAKRRDILFILVNSMTLENDDCRFCKKAQKELKKLNITLEMKRQSGDYSRPIILSHFPLYRNSDSICPLDIDSEFNVINENPRFKSKYDCLSLEATKQLIEMTNPRLVFDGHTHYSCYNELHGVPEFTIPSFSWRNIKTPSFLLLQLDNHDYFVNKCFLPSELNVIYLYTVLSVYILVYIILTLIYKFFFIKFKFDSIINIKRSKLY